MEILKGKKYKQIKKIGEYDFDFVGMEFEVINITDKVVSISNCFGRGGIEKEVFLEYFEIIEERTNKFEENEDYKVIYNDMATIVILKHDGSKGVSKCLPEDKYNREKGFKIAYLKACIKSMTKQIKKLSK